jgi:hypothetical protein
MSIFNQMIRGATCEPISQYDSAKTIGKPRTLRETIQDQIAYHKSKIADLEAARDSLTPEVESFVEAFQKLG